MNERGGTMAKQLEMEAPLSASSAGASSPFAAMLLLAFDHWQQMTRVAIVTAVIAAALVLLIPKEYESTARLVPPENPNSLMLAGIESKTGVSAGSAAGGMLKNTGSIFVPMLKSRTVQDRLIDRFDLRREYHVRYYFDARKRLARNSAISEDRQTGVITLIVTDRDAERSAASARHTSRN